MLPRQGSVSRRPGTVSWLGVHHSTNEAFLFPGNPYGRTILRDSPPGPPTTILGIASCRPGRSLIEDWPGGGLAIRARRHWAAFSAPPLISTLQRGRRFPSALR